MNSHPSASISLKRKWLPAVIGASVSSAVALCCVWAGLGHTRSTPNRSRIAVGVVDFDDGARRGPGRLREILSFEQGFDCEVITPGEVRRGLARKYDVLVFPGGDGGSQSQALGPDGRQAIREYLRAGGGYVGICAGAFLAASGDDWSLNVINAKSLTGVQEIAGWGEVRMEPRRAGIVGINLTSAGQRLFPGVPESTEVLYSGGPILSPAGLDDLPEYETLAIYRTEVWSFPFQRGTMIGTPAVITAAFGQGRVIAISPHPEMSAGQEVLIKQAVILAAKSLAESRPHSHSAL